MRFCQLSLPFKVFPLKLENMKLIMGCNFFTICYSFLIFEISKLPAIKYFYCCVVFYVKVIRKSYLVFYDSARCRNYFYQLLNVCYENKNGL